MLTHWNPTFAQKSRKDGAPGVRSLATHTAQPDGPSPIYEARMLQALHFTELQVEVDAITEIETSVISFIAEQKHLQIEHDSAWRASWKATSLKSWQDLNRMYLARLNATVEKARNLPRSAHR